MTMKAFRLIKLLCGMLALCGSAQAAVLNATFHSATTVPLAQLGNFNATGATVNFTLNFAPPVGTDLTLVRLVSFSSATTGSFTNLPHGQAVTMIFNGQPYDFVTNYYGGTGNDIVLEWASARPMAWGNNGNGQLGTNSTTQSNLPANVTTTGVLTGKTMISLSAGRNHSLALCSDGTVAAWGLNADGQIGANGGSQSTVPVLVSNLGVLATKRVIALAAGEAHSLALCSDGSVAAWGSNANGQLGRSGGSTANPVAVSTSSVLSGKRVVAIAAGQRHSVALLSTGEVTTWGYNFYGQLGDGGNGSKTVPVLVNMTGVLTGKSVAVIAAGSDHCLAICSDGTLASWGDNRDGQLGNGTTTESNVPVLVTTTGTFLATRTVTTIAAGADHSLALCSDGRIASWGRNSFGQLGRTSGSPLLPGGVSISGALSGKTVTSVAGGSSHSLALCSDGTLTAWGSNSFGEMGTGNTTSSNVPQNVNTTPLFAGQRFHAVASGPNAFHSLAIVASPPQPNELTAGTLISNGSFENGFSDWSVSDIQSPFRELEVSNNGYSSGYGLFSTSATHGNFSASSGFEGHGPGIVRLAHDVPVTAVEPFVRFDYRVGWDMMTFNGSTKARTFAVTIEPAGGGPVLQKTLILTAAPQTKTLDTGPLVGSVDMSAYVGTLVRVCFDLIVPEVNTGPAFFQLDNVRTAALLPASINPITNEATIITTDAATLNGIVNTNGLNATVEFEYGPTPTYGSLLTATPSPLTCTTDTFVSAAIAGLNKNATYHYRIKTTTSEGVKVGANKSFTTLPLAPILNGLSSDYGVTSARLYADVNPNGASTVVTFEYGLTTAYGSSTPGWESPITSSQTVDGSVSGITPGVTYHWRVKAQNAGGTTYSEDSIFESLPTHPGSPTLTTLAPTRVDRSYATLNGIVNANGSNATVDFEVGTTTHYNFIVSALPASSSGSTNQAFSGLWNHNHRSPGTTYHYRARALGAGGYVYGPDVTFTTPEIGFPSATTTPASGITQTTAMLNADVSANNGPLTTVSFEYGLDTSYGTVVSVPSYAPGNSPVSMQAQIPVSGESVTYHYRVKATNNIGTTYGQDMTFTTPDPHEAKLYGLSFSSGTLSPAFSRDVLTYTMSLPFETTGLTLSPTASTGIASVLLNGVSFNSGDTSSPLLINLGSNVFTIVVTALDGIVQQTYTIHITRSPPIAGDLDLSFKGTGKATLGIGPDADYAYAVAMQNDGKIIVVGSSNDAGNANFALARSLPDGTPDADFGTDGKVTTDFNGGPDTVVSVAIQSDGKIVVAGSAGISSTSTFLGITWTTGFGVARYHPDGTLDTTFNSTGKVTTSFPGNSANAAKVLVQGDGKIVAAGYVHNGTDNDFALVRYNSDGTLDTSFNTTGRVLTNLGDNDVIQSMALQSNGKIVVAGFTSTGGSPHSALARFNSDGTLDTTFNTTGIVIASLLSPLDVLSSVAIQSDGKIVAAGYSINNGLDFDMLVVRYHGDVATGTPGTPDLSFASVGHLFIASASGDDVANGLSLTSEGKILIGGRTIEEGKQVITLFRRNADGSPDTSFHGGGKATADFGSDELHDGGWLAMQEDGKAVVVGTVTTNGYDFAVARFLGDGPAIAVKKSDSSSVFDAISTVTIPGALPHFSASQTFTVHNTGTANLTGLGITIDGPDSSAFTVTSAPTAPVSPFGTTSFTVRFLPTSLGLKTAALHIASNVTGHMQSYDIGLEGSGLTIGENWRQSHFGTHENAGPAADAADPNGNGIPNLLEYALNGDPAGSSTGTAVLPQVIIPAGPSLELSFSRYLDRPDLTLTVQACDDLTGPWTDLATSVGGAPFVPLFGGVVVNETGSGNTRSVTVRDLFPTTDPAHPSRFMRLRASRP